MSKEIDSIQQRLTEYAFGLSYENLSSEAIHAAKARVIDILGVLIGGYAGEPCAIARKLAAQVPDPSGATVIGTRWKTTPDLAAFANATTARYAEMIDTYNWPGTFHGHPSDTVTPVLAAAEHARASGRDLITGIVLAYEIFCRFSDVFDNPGFDNTNFSCLGVAMAAGKLWGLSSARLAHCISMAVVPNVILSQMRSGHLSMFKAAAAGQAGRAGVFAALLARSGMEGPHLPFEGKSGWCDHVARKRFSLDTLGSDGMAFKILNTRIKNRASASPTIASVLAAEKVAPLKNIKEVTQVTVETYKSAKKSMGTGEHHWNPQARETADHSIPYVVAATLMDGKLTPRSFNDGHLWNPDLRALMQKIEVVENDAFTRAYEQLGEHRARIAVTGGGERLIGESGGDDMDLSTPKSDAQIEDKFRSLSEDMLSAKRVNGILDRLWHLEELDDVAEIPRAFVLI